jgi:hypothetical protein
MRYPLRRPRAALAVTACAMAAIAAVPAVASASPAQDPVPIRPGQYFTGYINSHPPGQAIIWTSCLGPIHPGQTGHPLANQAIEVTPAPVSTGSAADLGYTGTAATSIVATFGPSATTAGVLATFTSYFVVQDIPTTITVPCSGTGVVFFNPVKSSSTSFPAQLSVTFESQP